jgi:hypothetical protein
MHDVDKSCELLGNLYIQLSGMIRELKIIFCHSIVIDK